MKITFLGHAALLIEDANFKALVDPFLTNNPVYKKDPDHITDITHIFITHGHGDHVGDALPIAKETGAMIICNAELAGIFYNKDKTLKLHPMHIGGTFTFDFGRVKMTPALHGSAYKDEEGTHDGGNPCGFVIGVGDKKIYHAGDTGLTMDMTLLEAEQIDIAFLPIGGNYTMDIDDAVRAVSFIKPKTVVPIHYNTFGLIKANPQDFINKVQDADVYVIQPGNVIQL
jgi:L-ascorbate metabolism protein UlaG (beta-lactamase superfamily)